MNLAVLGAGAWGTALAIALSGRHGVRLWCRDPRHAKSIADSRENARYLAGVRLPPAVLVTAQAAEALAAAELVLLAIPVAALRATVATAHAVAPGAGLVCLCKGFEAGTMRLPHEVIAQIVAAGTRYGALSGPSFADEVARGLPAAVTLASTDGEFAQSTAHALHTGRLRVYSSEDLIGVEVGGAVKNVIAIAAGICDGLALGQSARAALITRGLAELTRLGLRLGGRLETFMGLSGIGDLALTCTSDLSRNRRVGLALASGSSLEAALSSLGHVAEGVFTAGEVLRLSERLGIDMPITRAIVRVLQGASTVREALEELLQREPRAEGVR